jgi:hypothetical protein
MASQYEHRLTKTIKEPSFNERTKQKGSTYKKSFRKGSQIDNYEDIKLEIETFYLKKADKVEDHCHNKKNYTKIKLDQYDPKHSKTVFYTESYFSNIYENLHIKKNMWKMIKYLEKMSVSKKIIPLYSKYLIKTEYRMPVTENFILQNPYDKQQTPRSINTVSFFATTRIKKTSTIQSTRKCKIPSINEDVLDFTKVSKKQHERNKKKNIKYNIMD